MAITTIEATTPDVIPAIEERTCDRWGAYQVSVGGSEFPVLNMTIEARKFASDSNGVAWSPEGPVVINLPDLFTAAETDPLVENVINALNALMASELTKIGVK